MHCICIFHNAQKPHTLIIVLLNNWQSRTKIKSKNILWEASVHKIRISFCVCVHFAYDIKHIKKQPILLRHSSAPSMLLKRGKITGKIQSQLEPWIRLKIYRSTKQTKNFTQCELTCTKQSNIQVIHLPGVLLAVATTAGLGQSSLRILNCSHQKRR